MWAFHASEMQTTDGGALVFSTGLALLTMVVRCVIDPIVRLPGIPRLFSGTA